MVRRLRGWLVLLCSGAVSWNACNKTGAYPTIGLQAAGAAGDAGQAGDAGDAGTAGKGQAGSEGGNAGTEPGDGGSSGKPEAGYAGSEAGSAGSAGEAGQAGQAGAGGAATPSDNHPPARPIIMEPAEDGQLVSGADVHMEAEPMEDPDEGDTHRCSDFAIWTLEPEERVWITRCIGGLEKLHTHLGDGIFEGSHEGRDELFPDTDFELRVRFRDSSGDPQTEYGPWAKRWFHTTRGATRIPNAPNWVVMQPGFKIEEIATGFQLPVNIAFVPNVSLHSTDPLFYVTELYGTIKVVTTDGEVGIYKDNVLDYTPSGQFPGSGEQGLAGIVVEPNTGDLFAAMLYDGDGGNFPMVVRYESTDGGFTAASSSVILDMPGEEQGQSHFISNLSIGPDDKLYVHMGDGFEDTTALDLESFRGKILRVNQDGSAPTDNPFYDAEDGITARDYIYAYGLRNPFGGRWRSDGRLFWVENGPSIDRLGVVTPGESYGWDGDLEDMLIGAIYTFEPACAPVNIAFVEDSLWEGSGFPPDKLGHAFISESGPTYASGAISEGKRISEVVLDENDAIVGDPTALVQYNGSGKATVAGLSAGPDGLYFTSLYKDTDYDGPTDIGASIYRVFYVGEPQDQGLRGEYFDNIDLEGQPFVRVDGTVAFNWSERAPAPGMPKDEFTVRWTGEVHPEFAETYTFTVDSDDGVRLWVNGELLIDRWDEFGEDVASGSIELSDQHYPIRLEYTEFEEYAHVILKWSSLSQPEQVIPTDKLHPAE